MATFVFEAQQCSLARAPHKKQNDAIVAGVHYGYGI